MLLTPSPRIRTLLAGTTVALCSGTNYVFSAYAPQLATRCGLSSTQLNLVGIAGNLGVYTSGPVWGVSIDRGGPRGVLCWAAGLIALGYAGIRAVYIHAGAAAASDSQHLTTTPTPPIKASFQTVTLLCLCMLATGFAASAGLNASLNTVARSFPAHQRATASGITLAGFGLSAFLFSSIAHAVFPGRTDGFLALLAVGTAVGMGVGVVGVKTVALLPAEDGEEEAAAHEEAQEEGYIRVMDQEEQGYADLVDTPGTGVGGPLTLERGERDEVDDYLTHPRPHHRSHHHGLLHEEVPLTVSRSRSTDVPRSSVDLLPIRSRSSREHLHSSDEALLQSPSLSVGEAVEKHIGGVEDGQVSGKQLLESLDFWAIVVILTLCTFPARPRSSLSSFCMLHTADFLS
ncbi:hypothetical protein QFC24_006526 [Naganishia onofrii]|uniref:Uncharacterized protein n=1 Tax=Naganishia onofrii TaxID=1851511 RepID=A0ACC2WZM0_9TREE|nr:hypothetical protein QFC24_006526 [Naganishia onofrii]